VFHDVESYGKVPANRSWAGIVALVSSGVSDIGIENIAVTKEMSEVVAFTDTLEFRR
jgi:ABC-type amino acid transport substrate-binding protein